MVSSATRTAGTLHLHVRYVGPSPDETGGARCQYEYLIRSTDLEALNEFTGTDLYSGVGKNVDADDMIYALADFLNAAAERYATNMCAPDDQYPAWLYEAAYLNADELAMIHIEYDRETTPASSTRYVSIVFHEPGQDADEALHILDTRGPEAAIEHLSQWDFGAETEYAAQANGHVYDRPPAGELDRTYASGDYLLSYNHLYGYIGLVRKTHPPDRATPYTESDLVPGLVPRRRNQQQKLPSTKLSSTAGQDTEHPTQPTPHSLID